MTSHCAGTEQQKGESEIERQKRWDFVDVVCRRSSDRYCTSALDRVDIGTPEQRPCTYAEDAHNIFIAAILWVHVALE